MTRYGVLFVPQTWDGAARPCALWAKMGVTPFHYTNLRSSCSPASEGGHRQIYAMFEGSRGGGSRKMEHVSGAQREYRVLFWAFRLLGLDRTFTFRHC